jgi:23S rRNA maturation mini-RNase III
VLRFGRLAESSVLSDTERDVVRWALHAPWQKPRAELTRQEYAQASALETLVLTWLYLQCCACC